MKESVICICLILVKFGDQIFLKEGRVVNPNLDPGRYGPNWIILSELGFGPVRNLIWICALSYWAFN